jgi:hypothetical protein
MSGALDMRSKYFTFYKITDKFEITIGIRVRNLILNLYFCKISKKLKFNFYKVSWPMDMDVLTLWKQVDWAE